MLPKKTKSRSFSLIVIVVLLCVLAIKFLPDTPIANLPVTEIAETVKTAQVPTVSEVIEDIRVPDSPAPSPFVKYTVPTLPVKNTYAVFLVGDSMTVALGPHPFRLSQRLNAAYPHAGFIIDNYGIGSKNILSLPDMLKQEVDLDGKHEPAILSRDYDILLIESFANNPMSDLPLEEGLRKQWEVLDSTIMHLLRERPNSVIILVATVAPSDKYGTGSIQLPPELRKNYARERRIYLENFIRYARERELPLVNAYDVTRVPTGDAKPGFISTNGYIHPSQMGIEFVQDIIADYIINQQIIPSKEKED